MKSRTSCCNGALLKRLAVKGLPLWGAYLLLWIVLLPMMLYSGDRWQNLIDVRDHVLSMAVGGSQILGALYGVASACMVFHWMYKSRSANFFGSLPLTRGTLFTTCFLAGLMYAVIPHLVIFFVSVPSAGFWGAALVVDLVIWFTVMNLVYLFYYGLAVLLAMIVGNLVALPVLFGIVNFTAVVVEAVVRSLMEYFIYGLSFRGDFLLDWASPLYYTLLAGEGPNVQRVRDLVTYTTTDLYMTGWPMIWIMAAVGVVFVVIAFLLHKHRRSESAGDVIAVRHLKPVMLYCFTVGCSLVLGTLLAEVLLSDSIGTEDFIPVILCMVAGGFVGYFGGQMLLHKSLRVFRMRYWANWAVATVAIVAVMLCARYDLFGYAHYVPAAHEVEGVNLGYGGEFYDDPAFLKDVLEFHQDCIDRQYETERANPEEGYNRMYVGYKMKDGSLVEREYLLPLGKEWGQDENSLIRMYETLYNEPEYRVLRSRVQIDSPADIESCQIYTHHAGHEEIWLTRDEAYEFIKTCLEPDVRETNLEYTCFCGEHLKTYTTLNIQISVYEDVPVDRGSLYYYFSVTDDAHRVLDYAAAKGVEAIVEK